MATGILLVEVYCCILDTGAWNFLQSELFIVPFIVYCLLFFACFLFFVYCASQLVVSQLLIQVKGLRLIKQARPQTTLCPSRHHTLPVHHGGERERLGQKTKGIQLTIYLVRTYGTGIFDTVRAFVR